MMEFIRSICENNADSCKRNTVSFPLQLFSFVLGKIQPLDDYILGRDVPPFSEGSGLI